MARLGRTRGWPARPGPRRLDSLSLRPQGPCARTQEVLRRVTARRSLYMCPAVVRGRTVLRFVVGSRLTEAEDVRRSWEEIVSQAEAVLQDEEALLAPAVVPVGPAAVSCDPDRAKTNSVVHMLGAAASDAQHTV